MSTYRSTLLATALLATLGALASTAASARDNVQITGSSTVYPFATAVAESFGKAGKFKTPVVESTGTGGGFKLFCSGVGAETPDVNDASRAITDSERDLCKKNGIADIAEIKIGYDGIIIAGDAKQPGFNVTRDQIWRAVGKTVPVNGKWVANPYKSWNDIDKSLPKRELAIFGPAPNHGTRDAFRELVMDPACEKAPESAALSADDRKKVCGQVREDGVWTDVSEDYALVMGKLKGNKTAVAVFTYSYLEQNRDKIRAATVDGITASLETIASGQYPISRPLYVYVKKAHIGVIPGLYEFLSEFVSERAAGADGYLVDKGLIPMPKKELDAQRALVKGLARK